MSSAWGNSWGTAWGNSWGTTAPVTSTIGRPASDTSVGSWLASAGGALWPMLDEVTPDPADYIYTSTKGVDCEMALSATAYPGGLAQTLKLVASSTSGDSLQIVLLNTGGTVIKTITQPLTAIDTQYDFVLSPAEIAAINSGAVSIRLKGI